MTLLQHQLLVCGDEREGGGREGREGEEGTGKEKMESFPAAAGACYSVVCSYLVQESCVTTISVMLVICCICWS